MNHPIQKRIAIGLMCISMLAAPLAGCSGSDNTSSDPSAAAESTTPASNGGEADGEGYTGNLRIASMQQVENPEGPLQAEIVQEFLDQNPGLTVEWIGIPSNDMTKKIMAFAAADDMPDIFGSGNEFYPSAVEMGLSADLNTLFPQEFIDTFYPSLIKASSYDGQLVSVPLFCMVSGLLYRADWFEEEGLEPPETWEDFIEVSKALTKDTDGDGQIDQWGFAMIASRNQSGESRYNYIQRSFGVRELYQDDAGKWQTDIGGDDYKKVLEMFCNFALEDDIVPPGVLETSYAEAANLIVSEKAAMILSGSNAVGTITAQNPDLKGKLASCVIPMGTQKIANPSTTGFSISAASQNKEAAAALLMWMCEDDNLLKWNGATGHVPTTERVAHAPQLQSIEMKGFMEALQYAYEVPQHPGMLEIMDAMGEAYQSVLAGNATVDEAAQKAQQKTEEIIASYE